MRRQVIFHAPLFGIVHGIGETEIDKFQIIDGPVTVVVKTNQQFVSAEQDQIKKETDNLNKKMSPETKQPQQPQQTTPNHHHHCFT
jgi:hypothetical protein